MSPARTGLRRGGLRKGGLIAGGLVLHAAAALAGDPPDATAQPVLKIPAAWIQEGDERPLEMIQQAALDEAIRTERAALEHEAGWSVGRNNQVRTNRVISDRVMIDLFAERARVSTIQTASERDLSLADRYLLAFIRDKLRTAAVPMGLIEAWTDQNQRFIGSSEIAARDLAIATRDSLLRALQLTQKLRLVEGNLTHGPLTDEVRTKLIETFRMAFPDAPLPVIEVAPAMPPGLAASLSALNGGVAPGALNFSGQGAGKGVPPAATAGAPSIGTALPRLDGVEAPQMRIPDLRQALKALQQAQAPETPKN